MRKGFEPPVRANVHLFSRQAPSTTRTPHRWDCKFTIKFSICNLLELLEPLGEVVLRVEVVHHEADPAGDEHQDAGDDLAHEGDGLLDDVEDGEDREDQTDEIDDGTHGNHC